MSTSHKNLYLGSVVMAAAVIVATRNHTSGDGATDSDWSLAGHTLHGGCPALKDDRPFSSTKSGRPFPRENRPKKLVERLFRLDYLKPEEAVRTLRQVYSGDGVSIDFPISDDGGRVLIQSSSFELCHAAVDVLHRVDVPTSEPLTRFVKLENAEVSCAAKMVVERIGLAEPEFAAVADTRTNRVFMMGDGKTLNRAEEILAELDGR